MSDRCVDNSLVYLVPKPMSFLLHQSLLIELIAKINILMPAIPKMGNIRSSSLTKSNSCFIPTMIKFKTYSLDLEEAGFKVLSFIEII